MNQHPIESASTTGLSPRLAAVLAYSAWWISGLLLWWIERRDPYVRFHAAQSVVVFGIVSGVVAGLAGLALVAVALVPDAFAFLLWTALAIWAAGEVLWVAAIWQAAQGRRWRMPVVGGLADRISSVSEEG